MLVKTCPDCPSLLPLHEPKGLESVKTALQKFNKESNHASYFKLMEVGRISTQVTSFKLGWSLNILHMCMSRNAFSGTSLIAQIIPFQSCVKMQLVISDGESSPKVDSTTSDVKTEFNDTDNWREKIAQSKADCCHLTMSVSGYQFSHQFPSTQMDSIKIITEKL